MHRLPVSWDYLIVTASNDSQAAAYQKQLKVRQDLMLLSGVENVLVVSDPAGKRIGSGGSTLQCLMSILSRELMGAPQKLKDPGCWLEVLQRLRILIVHAGGDSKRLPSYGPCGKVFVPIPGESDGALATTLLDRQLPVYLQLPPPVSGKGQTVVTSGDVLLKFDPTRVRFSPEGITGLGCYLSPEQATHHGVFCPQNGGEVRLYLQKPSFEEQVENQAVNRHGQVALDIGVLSLDAEASLKLLQFCDPVVEPSGSLNWSGPMAEAILDRGLDVYREICCGLGVEATAEHHRNASLRSGSKQTNEDLARIFSAISDIPFHLNCLSKCGFLHFGTSRQLVSSGSDLLSQDYGISHFDHCLSINNAVSEEGRIQGRRSWVEGCRVQSTLELEGDNVVVGVDVEEPLSLPQGCCLDVLEGLSRYQQHVWFVRCFGIEDLFNRGAIAEETICNIPSLDWLEAVGAKPEDVWGEEDCPHNRTLWNARIFPAVSAQEEFRKWLWIYSPQSASDAQRSDWRKADRYSCADILQLVDQESFHLRRIQNRASELRGNVGRVFRPESPFSAAELAFLFENMGWAAREDWCLELFREVLREQRELESHWGIERLELSRLLHTIGSAVELAMGESASGWKSVFEQVKHSLDDDDRARLLALGLDLVAADSAEDWTRMLCDAAFDNLSQTITFGKESSEGYPRCVLRSDEIVWGRAPARLDLGGGWSDTPPYSLENGGSVLNAAVDLNGQPPIHVYARIIEEPEFRINSVDHSNRVAVRTLDELSSYRKRIDGFGLAKAALVRAGFGLERGEWPSGVRTLPEMLDLFGGGIELTTLAAIPSGSGLGTSSIMGAVLTAVINRVLGRNLTQRELFYQVLQLEQELTTGGGWQDQIGGVVDGVKVISSGPGIVPNPQISFVTPDVLAPELNHGQTLLYYTGIRRLAKNILREVVGGYLDRTRGHLASLRALHEIPPSVAEAMARKDMKQFGAFIDRVWSLNKRLDPDSTTPEVEGMLRSVNPHVWGAKLLGAGGGGFLLMVCKSPEDAHQVRRILETSPPNDRARFFDFSVSREGLVVTVC